jgi:hypothetical protein
MTVSAELFVVSTTDDYAWRLCLQYCVTSTSRKYQMETLILSSYNQLFTNMLNVNRLIMSMFHNVRVFRVKKWNAKLKSGGNQLLRISLFKIFDQFFYKNPAFHRFNIKFS